MRYRIALLSLLLAWNPQPAPAAQPSPRLQIECGVDTSRKVDFGVVNPQGNTDIVGQITGWCRNAQTPYVRICVGMGRAEQGSIDPRYMSDGREDMAFNIYSNASRTIIWGDGSTPLARIVPIDIATPSGDGQTDRIWYGRVPPQPELREGRYRTNFDRSNTFFVVHGYTSFPPLCSAADPHEGSFSFRVEATVEGYCTLETTPLDFGLVGIVDANLQAESSISVDCTDGTAYSLALDAGRGNGATMLERKVTRLGGAETLIYRLFNDSARIRPWGDGSLGTSTVSDRGNGRTQTHQVYGELLPQQAAARGLYQDTVTATLTY